MRRSILIVMLDVMVLSVLALTAGKSGGSDQSNPTPMYHLSNMIEEGLRQEQSLQEQVMSLESQLAQASELAKKALEQVHQSQLAAERERTETRSMQSELLQAKSEIAKSQLVAERAEIERVLAARTAAEAQLKAEQMDRRAREMEEREAKAQARTETAIAKARQAEAEALAAERKVISATTEQERLKSQLDVSDETKQDMELAVKKAEEKLRALERQLASAKANEQSAVKAQEQLLSQNNQRTEKVAQLREKVAKLEVQKDGETQKVAQLEEQKREAEEEAAKSIWIRRDDALRLIKIHYTEYSRTNDRSFTTDQELTMPMVRLNGYVFVPAEFKTLGLQSSIFSGLSASVTDVKAELRPVASTENKLSPISSILVPGAEPQVCLVRFAGNGEGAIDSISMDELKSQRLSSALLFTPNDVNEHGRVEIMPIVGTDYLKILSDNGKKPKVGDYLMSERGEFIGIMVTKENCYVVSQALKGSPAPISIPMIRSKTSKGYFTNFVSMLKEARQRVKSHQKQRQL